MSVIPPEDILKYMNMARTNPPVFAKYVKDQLNAFIDQNTLPLKLHCNYSTNEGKQAWREAYDYLSKHKPLPPFMLNEGLNLAADDHALDMATHNIFGHNSSNGQSFSNRIEKRCGKAYGSSGQNIGSDFKVAGRNHALQTVLGLIIDDGVSSRGHRKNIFSADFKYVGCSSRVQGDKVNTVIDFYSQNLPIISKNKNPSHNQKILYEQQQLPKKQPSNQKQNQLPHKGGIFGGGHFSKFGNDFGGKFGDKFGNFKTNFDHDNLAGKGWEVSKGNPKGQSSGGSGGRYVTNKSTSTKTRTVNGVKTTEKVTKIKYSDGTEEEEREETITS